MRIKHGCLLYVPAATPPDAANPLAKAVASTQYGLLTAQDHATTVKAFFYRTLRAEAQMPAVDGNGFARRRGRIRADEALQFQPRKERRTMNIDLDKVEEAFFWLAETPGGDQALKGLSDACDALRSKLPNELNDAETRYILERLMEFRSLGDWEKKLEPAEVSGFAQQPGIAALFPTVSGVGRAQLPAELTGNVLNLNYGFSIKASIASPRF